jgi:two-component system LytT family response regulator
VTVAGSNDRSAEALASLRDAQLDVVFVDVQMPGMTGFELLGQLNRDIPVVFTTASTGALERLPSTPSTTC